MDTFLSKRMGFPRDALAAYPAVVLSLASVLAGCQRDSRFDKDGGQIAASDTSPEPTPPADLRAFRDRALAAQRKRLQSEERIRGLSPEELIEELRRDSENQVEPFNSLAFDEFVKRHEKGQKVGIGLKPAVQEEGFLLGLLALRRVDEDRDLYPAIDRRERVEILIDALKESRYFNIWGLPHRQWEEGGRAIIAEGIAERETKGSVVIDALKELLSDQRPARLWGSGDAIEAEKYKYRVCDYALALYLAIVRPGDRIEINPDPEVRDRAIQSIRGNTAK